MVKKIEAFLRSRHGKKQVFPALTTSLNILPAATNPLPASVNKKEELKPIENLKSRKIISTSICLTLLSLLIRVDLSNTWSLAEPNASIGEESTIRIGEHLFSDYLLPFEVASVLLLMAMIGAIVLARRDVMNEDISTGLPVDQELIEKPNDPLLIKKN